MTYYIQSESFISAFDISSSLAFIILQVCSFHRKEKLTSTSLTTTVTATVIIYNRNVFEMIHRSPPNSAAYLLPL